MTGRNKKELEGGRWNFLISMTIPDVKMPTIKPPTMSMMPKPPSIFAMKLARPSGITRNGKR